MVAIATTEYEIETRAQLKLEDQMAERIAHRMYIAGQGSSKRGAKSFAERLVRDLVKDGVLIVEPVSPQQSRVIELVLTLDAADLEALEQSLSTR